jgi:hypothetical protein
VPYQKTDGTYVHTELFPVVASGARTTTASAPAVEVGNRHALRSLFLNVTASSGTTPTLDLKLETSADNSTWYTVGSFAQKTGTANERKSFAGLDRYVRLTWTLGGTTPSFTFAVTGGELV